MIGINIIRRGTGEEFVVDFFSGSQTTTTKKKNRNLQHEEDPWSGSALTKSDTDARFPLKEKKQKSTTST
jgi:hypothetical protein